MVKREFWQNQIETAWQKRPIIWLSGVRRVGKTLLAKSLENIEYFDCELPRTRQYLEDPESFLKETEGKRIVLDEVHRLPNPSEILKIAADHFPKSRILATGSSSFQASAKFKDTLTGRKTEIWLTPMNSADLIKFKNTDLKHRLKMGGLPPFFLSQTYPEQEFQEWIDSYWAKDIQELFRLEKRYSFQRFLELLFASSGGIFEASSFSTPCEISRPTVTNYLNVLELTKTAIILRPFSTHRSTEIVAAPKVYVFDTGFIYYFKGWEQLRAEDLGLLWEHFVLNEILSRKPGIKINYWRNKNGHEIDFVLQIRGKKPIAVECKWSANNVQTKNLKSFRQIYPEGENWMVLHDVERPFKRTEGRLEWSCLGLADLIKRLEQL